MPRKTTSWVDSFLDFTADLGSPRIFRLWTALSVIAGALERKVWVKTSRGALYPNIYVFLVGPPGVGKTLLTSTAYDLLSELEDHHIAPTNVSRASLVDSLREAERRFVKPDQHPSVIQFNSLTILADELGVLIPSYENDFMNTLTSVYDGKVYSERKRTKDLQFRIDAPQLNMLVATTPSFLNHLLPEGAWDQGFLSRVMLIYSGENIIQSLWTDESKNEKLQEELVKDLKEIGSMYNKMVFSEEAGAAINEWHMRRGPPQPEHPKLIHYTTRRTGHLLKLCMLATASRTNKPVIELEDFQQALDWLIEAEGFMPDIFKSMTTGGDLRVIDETWYFTYEIWMKEKKPIPEPRVLSFIVERAPVHNVSRILEIMVRQRILQEQVEPKIGKCYVPKPRRVA